MTDQPQVRVRAKPDRAALQLYYLDNTGKEFTRSAGTDDWQAAERAAAVWELELRQHGRIGNRITWSRFRVRVEDEFLPSRAPKTRLGYGTAMSRLEDVVVEGTWLDTIDAGMISQAVAKWRANHLAESSVATNLRHLRAIFRWAVSIELLRRAPHFDMPRQTKRLLMRGRPIREPEYQAILAAIPVVQPQDATDFRRLIKGLWLSGLRLGEALTLSWDSPPLQIDLDGGRYPRLLIYGEGQKSRRDEIAVITPDFAEFLRQTPPAARVGRVFPMRLKSQHQIGRAISAIARRAKVFVAGDRPCGAHDLRRAFGTRWASEVKPLALKTLMRHASVETTLRYYVDQDADDVGAEIWGQGRVPDSVPGNTPEEGFFSEGDTRQT